MKQLNFLKFEKLPSLPVPKKGVAGLVLDPGFTGDGQMPDSHSSGVDGEGGRAVRGGGYGK